MGNPLPIDNTVTMATQRLQYRRRNPYNTRSNKVRVIKTPGGSLRLLHLKKRGSAPKCGDCGTKLLGIPALRPHEYATISKADKTVRRAYGGSRCGNCVRDRIVAPSSSRSRRSSRRCSRRARASPRAARNEAKRPIEGGRQRMNNDALHFFWLAMMMERADSFDDEKS